METRRIREQHELARAKSSATWAAKKSLSPKVILSVAVVSFSLITGTQRRLQRRRKRCSRIQVVDAVETSDEFKSTCAACTSWPPARLIGAKKRPLPNRRRRLKLIHGARARVEAHQLHPERNRAEVTITTSSPPA